MRAIVAPVLTVILLAGCLDVPAMEPNLSVPSSATTELRFEGPIRIDALRNNQGETFVAVSPDGREVITCLHGEFKEPSIMYASLDGGDSFREIRAEPSPMVGGDCEVAMGPDGTWYFMHSTVAAGTIVATSDQGKSWTINYLAALPTNGMADRPWIDTIGDVAILSYMPLFAQPGPIEVTRSTDKGRTWSDPQHANSNPRDMPNSVNGHMTPSPDGKTMRIPIVRYLANGVPGTAVQADYLNARSDDQGVTWQQEHIIGPIPSFIDPPNVAVAADGSIYFAYRVPNATASDLVFVRSVDDGKTWSTPELLLGGFSSLGWNWINARPDGSVDLLIQGDTTPIDGKPRDSTYVSLLRIDARLDPPLRAAEVVGKGAGEFIAIDHDANGRAFITYIDENVLYLVRESPGVVG